VNERNDVPKKLQKLYQTSMSGRNQASAIKFFCLECVGYDSEEVKNCTDSGCSLYPYRVTGRKVKKTA
jgi:hypothetical protein